MPLFDNKQETNLKACIEMVNAVLTQMGIEPAEAMISSDSGPAWALTRGSAEVFVFLSPGDSGDNFIQVTAPVLRPPSDGAVLQKLYTKLLELNANDLTGAAFGLRDGDVVVTTDRSTTGLDQVEVEEMIRRVGEYADRYDDELAKEYGGTRASDL